MMRKKAPPSMSTLVRALACLDLGDQFAKAGDRNRALSYYGRALNDYLREGLPGMAAAQTLVPVLGVPVESAALKGMDSLLSIVQMPGGIPVGTLAIGKAGAINAALLAIAILGNSRAELREKLRQSRARQTDNVRQQKLP